MKTPPNESAKKRRQLAKKKHALPDGSFPIPNKAYLEKAKHRIGSAHPSKRAAARALIERRAKELGGSGLGASKKKKPRRGKKSVKASESDPEAVLLVSSRVYPGLDRSPKQNWVDKAGGLPDFIERVAKHLHYEQGFTISHAIATAVSKCKKWCAKGLAKACNAIRQWEQKKAGTRVKATDIRGRKLTDLEFAEIIEEKILLAGRGVGASGTNRPFDATKYLRDPTTGKFSSKFTPAEMIAGHRIVEAGVINLQVGQVFKLPNQSGWVQRSEGGYLVQGPAGLRVAVKTATEAVQAAANIMIGQLRRVGETKK